MRKKFYLLLVLLSLTNSVSCEEKYIRLGAHEHGQMEHPLSGIKIHNIVVALSKSASIEVDGPTLLGSKGEDFEWVTINLRNAEPSQDDWVGVFSPANFNESICPPQTSKEKQSGAPFICTAPLKFKFANYSNVKYTKTGKTSLKFRLINQRGDFSFAFFSGGLQNMTVTWTSGYNIDEAVPFVEWGWKGQEQKRSPAGTLTFHRNSMCGSPARTVGWRDPGFIHTSFLKDLWPNVEYTYKLGHLLSNGSVVMSKQYSFKSPPFPGQESLQRIVIFGDMGKQERDGSNEYADYQPGSLMTTDTLVKDLDNIDAVYLIGDLPYANGYISQWDQFTAQVEPIASRVPFMIASGNHERTWENSGSIYNGLDSGGECGVPAETLYYVPAENRAKFWYAADYGMFHFCIGDTEHDWREGSEQYKFIEQCFASANRHKQPWLIFAAHRVLGYSSNDWYAKEGSFEEPMGREHLQKLWQKYKVDMAFYGHVHNYERVCPIYQNQCVNKETSHYSGVVNGTIHVVVGGGGSHLSQFTSLNTRWSVFKDYDWGFVKLTAFNQSSLLFEYKKSKDGKVYDSFTISRDYKDVLACVHDACEPTTLAN
ncbi:nucleotide pyrophosphatase/phosphodiesterase-like isoform X2 [Solanum lycopersicum]|uniref:nucleotide pyrophosphatase/phosphodiesterase-like isoform X2 n=1 Tax=Solanum lycopersicum TaxID=4081 RepID=UPI0037495BB0